MGDSRQPVSDSFTRYRCSCCGRTPLVGERVHVGGEQGAERSVCELCLLGSEDATIGAELRTERVHAAPRPLVVRSVAA